MNQRSALLTIVCFGLPEHDVDLLLQVVADAGVARPGWLVVGCNMSLLGALDVQWNDTMDVILVHAPANGPDVRDASLDILANEGRDARQVIWVHGADSTCEPPSECARLIHASMHPVDRLARLLVQYLRPALR